MQRCRPLLTMFVSLCGVSTSDAGVLNDYNPWDVNIPDNNGSVNSDLDLSGAPADAEITKVKVYYEIRHACPGDLDVWLTTYYSGSWHDYFLYHHGDLSCADDIVETRDNIHRWDGASPNNTWYLVARDNATGNVGYIDFFELWVYYESNEPPNEPYNEDPNDGEDDVSINSNLDWSCSDPNNDTLYYTVYFEKNDSSPDVIIKNNSTGSSADPGTLDYGSHYYWKVKADDHNGGVTWGPVWDFYTQAEPVIDADITVTSVAPNPVVAGNEITIYYSVENTGNVSHSFGVGCEIRHNDTVVADVCSETTPAISDGSTHNGDCGYPIPSGWSEGTYVARCVAWSGAPGASDWLDSHDRSFSVEAPSIDAQIVSVSFSDTTVVNGDNITTATVTVQNTGEACWSFYVGGSSIRDGGTVWHDWLPARAMLQLCPGSSGSIRVNWCPPLSTTPGSYGFYSKVFRSSTGPTFVAEDWQGNVITVMANPQPVAVRPTEIIVRTGEYFPLDSPQHTAQLVDLCLAHGIPAISLMINTTAPDRLKRGCDLSR